MPREFRFLNAARTLVVLDTDCWPLLILATQIYGIADPAEDRPPISLPDCPRLVVTTFDGPPLPRAYERRLSWDLTADLVGLDVAGAVRFRLSIPEREGTVAVSHAALDGPLLRVFRLALETPIAIFLSRSTHNVLHAGAVAGPRGAVVLRGPAGAGKSTLTAAAWKAGLTVLGDESLLVLRSHPDRLSSSIRDLTILPQTARLLDIGNLTEPAFAGGEAKRRIDLLVGSKPEDRNSDRRATLVLGPREPGPARLVRLGAADFLAEFERGSVPEERLGTDPTDIARHWAQRDVYRLDGAIDLDGAVRLLKSLCA